MKDQRILICEDDPDVAEILRRTILRHGHTADVALNASQARACLESNVYAGMTLDIVLPDMNGIEFFKQLRANPDTRLLPVIFVSAKAARSAEQINGTAVNVVDWLDKPIDEGRLTGAIDAAIAMNTIAAQRILYIEDDPDLVQIVRGQLGSRVSCVSAASLAAARQLLGKERFDLVILDLILPDGRGEDLLPAMLNPNGAPIPVIVFSALEVPAEIAQRVEAVLVKSRSTEQMLTEAIDAFVTEHNLMSSAAARNDIDPRTEFHG